MITHHAIPLQKGSYPYAKSEITLLLENPWPGSRILIVLANYSQQ
jgi:hypothetical protein